MISMADVIQFNCPACAAMLRLPLDLAASEGPCPCCQSDIIAPDPYRGIGAHLPPPPTQAAPIEAFRPFSDSPPLSPCIPDIESKPVSLKKEPDITTFPAPTAPETGIGETVPPPRPPEPLSVAESRTPPTVFVLSLLLTAVVCLATGYMVGIRSDWLVAKTPFPKLEVTAEPVEAPTKTVLVKPPVSEPEPAPVVPPVPEPETETPPTPEPQTEPVKASAMAESALKAFLDAPDWTTRSAYVLLPEKVRAAMEAYSRTAADGPTSYKSVSVENSYTDRKTGNTLFIFKVITNQHPDGFPAAVSETSSGWLVDWESFTEFRDDQFKAFAEGPADRTGRFHLIVSSPPPARAANTENEHFSSFLLDPPIPGRQRMAYVRKTAEIHARLRDMTASGIFTPVLEVAKRKTPDGKTYLEITAIIAEDWLPVKS